MKYNVYYDLYNRLNILNNYNNNVVKYELKNITNINLQDIKISYSSTSLYNKYKLNIFNTDSRFKFISFNNTNELVFKCYYKDIKLMYFCKYYHLKNDIVNINSKINNDLVFTYLLSGLFLKNKVHHLLLPIMNIDIPSVDLEQIIVNKPINDKILDLIGSNKIYNICNIQIRECKDEMKKLDEYIINNKINYKILLFQIIYSIACIQNKYNDFRHNNLILNNIYIFVTTTNNIVYSGFNNDSFNIKDANFLIKLSRFEYSIIPNKYGHSNYNNKYIKFSNKINPYYDVYTFLNSLTKILRKNKIETDEYFKIFMDKYLPDNIRNEFNNEMIALPINILYDDYFKEFLINSNIDNTKASSLKINSIKVNKKVNKNVNKNIRLRKFNKDNVNYTPYIRIIKNKYINKHKNNMIGGAIVPPYKEKITPFKSNEQKASAKQYAEDKPTTTQPIIFEQKIYDTTKQKQDIPSGPIISHLSQPGQNIYQQPLQKIYNISLSNPLGNYQIINHIYEDQLPKRLLGTGNYTAVSLFERSQLIDFVRNIMIDIKDGEDMRITGGKNSFLSYIKLLDINPYSNGHPYETLSENFLLYRAGYPIRLDQKSKTVKISKNSMGLNVRLYMMTIGDINCKKINFIDSDNFDLWREIRYYDWVKTGVCKKKVSPNFISPILYKIDTQSKIDWKKIENLKIKNKSKFIHKMLINNRQKINNLHTIKSMFNTPIRNKKADLTTDINKVLVLLTESPTSSIIQWSSPMYVEHGTIKKMISTGYHSPDVWKSILFQLIYAITVLYEKGIYFENFSLNDNVYIKDIEYNSHAIGSWIYKIDNIDYYIPNYGYILMIDSKYSDVDIEEPFIPDAYDDVQKFKIYGSIFNNNSYNTPTDIKSKLMEQFKEILHPDNFNHLFKMNKGVIPDKSILDLLSLIQNDSINNSMRHYLHTYFRCYLHNRIGTFLSKGEKENLNTLTPPNFDNYIGKLLVYERRNNEFVWILYNKVIDQFNCEIITLDQNNINYNKINVNKASLKELLGNEKIVPESIKNINYNESYIYETYDIDNLIIN